MKLDYRFGSIENTMLEHDKLRNISGVDTQITVRADVQTSGTGRSGHAWYSPHGGLWFTFDVPCAGFEPSFALYAGYCLHSLLQRLFGLPDLRVKWTNDLYWNDLKLAGILCKHQPASKGYVVGLGLNTNNTPDARMGELKATSLRTILGETVSNDWLQKLYIHEVVSQTTLLEDTSQYLRYCDEHLYGKGLKACVEGPDGMLEGVIRGIDNNGHLLVEGDVLHSVSFGSIVKIYNQ